MADSSRRRRTEAANRRPALANTVAILRCFSGGNRGFRGYVPRVPRDNHRDVFPKDRMIPPELRNFQRRLIESRQMLEQQTRLSDETECAGSAESAWELERLWRRLAVAQTKDSPGAVRCLRELRPADFRRTTENRSLGAGMLPVREPAAERTWPPWPIRRAPAWLSFLTRSPAWRAGERNRLRAAVRCGCWGVREATSFAASAGRHAP
jgi:hypothetical protein